MPYTYSMGTIESGVMLVDMLQVDVDLTSTAMLWVDALDPGWRDWAGVRVEIDRPYEGVYREVAPFQFDNEPLTTEDRMDLLFIGVEPGPVTITATEPDGTPCVGMEDVVLEPGGLAHVSRYCPDIAPDVE